MKIEIIKEEMEYLKGKSYQMRIDFLTEFCDSHFETQFVEDLDNTWREIGVFYMWHIGQNFVDGFFEDAKNLTTQLSDIINATEQTLTKYESHISQVIFKDIN